MARLPARVVLLAAAASAALATSAAAAPRMYVATSSTLADGAPVLTAEGYVVDGITPVADDLRLDVVRGGVTVATQTATGYVAIAPSTAAPGDVVRIRDLTTLALDPADATAVREITLTGRPTLDDTLACGSAAFAGDNDAGWTVSLRASNGGQTLSVPAFLPAGERFGGSFSTALVDGAQVTVQQARAIDGTFTVFNSVRRPAGACPVVEAPAAPAPAPAPAAGPAPMTITAPAPAQDLLPPGARLTFTTALLRPAAAYRALVRGRFTDRVAVDEAGAVHQTLYLDDGAALPRATAAAKRRVATVLGSGTAAVARPGAVAITVTLSKNGSRRLKRARATRVALVTTVADAAGNARVLAPKRFTVKRTK